MGAVCKTVASARQVRFLRLAHMLDGRIRGQPSDLRVSRISFAKPQVIEVDALSVGPPVPGSGPAAEVPNLGCSVRL
jgi:hypothetical protein